MRNQSNNMLQNRWLWLALVFALGLATVFVATQTAGVSTGPRQLERTQAYWRLFDGRTVGQVLQIDPSQLVGMRLYIGGPRPGNNGMLSVQVYSFEHKRNIAAATIPLANVQLEQATDIRFDRVDANDWPSAEPLTIELRITVTGVPEATPLIVYGSTNRFPNGPVVINGKQRASHDLAFAVLYPGTAFDSVLPITHIAEHRPGVFGWVPLYGLLAWSALCVAFTLVLFFTRYAR